MKKTLALLMGLLLPMGLSLKAAASGDAESYKMTITKIEFKKSDGTWVTIASPNQEIDIAAANAGDVAGSLLSDSAIPAGSYVNFRLTANKSLTVKGSDAAGTGCVGTNYTKSGGAVTLTGTAATSGNTATWPQDPPTAVTLTETVESATTVVGDAGEMTQTLKLGAASGGTSSDGLEISGQSDLGSPIVIGETSTVSIFFKFDTRNTVHCQQTGLAAYAMIFTPPGAGTTCGITVDGTVYSINAASMQMQFPS